MTKIVTCPECMGRGFIEIHELRDDPRPDVPVCKTVTEVCGRCHGAGRIQVPMTNADRWRAMTDEEMVDLVDKLLQKLCDAGYNTLIAQICDDKGDCGDGFCSDARRRDCIRRFLNRPAEG